MFSNNFYIFTYVCLFLYITQSCISEPLYPPQLVLYSAGEPEYTDVLVKRVGDNLTLVCELRDDLTSLTSYVWNYIPDNNTAVRAYTVSPPSGPSTSSQLYKPELQLSDSGQYFCSAPPFSVTKYILVQTRGPVQCARGAFWCGTRCVLPGYVCDGFVDCVHGEDESAALCSAHVCSRSDKLNCSSGRCISAAACCRRAAPLCRQPSCCDEYPRHAPLEGYVDVEFPKQFEDRHAPDDYGFIQSTIYTVTACALIFMLAVVLLVSAICKMHMKRAALRQYTQPDLYHRHQAPRFPPCYEASRLLESSPPLPPAPEPPPPPAPLPRPRGLARLTNLFSNRYRQVPTDPPEVEMTSYHPPSSPPSPRSAPYPPDFRFLEPDPSPLARDLYMVTPENASYMATPESEQPHNVSYMATPVEFFRRRAMRRNTLERVFEHMDRQRLTLQLGRFQLSLPRLGRPGGTTGATGGAGGLGGTRPDTPTLAEINIDDLDFVRLNSNDTYTLNGRTIRLLGGNFENYPPVLGGTPPSYNDAVRYKLFGPPPEYLSREGLNVTRVDDEARDNVEMPPCYEELTGAIGGSPVSIGGCIVGAIGGSNAGTIGGSTGAIAGLHAGAIGGSNAGVLADNVASGGTGNMADSHTGNGDATSLNTNGMNPSNTGIDTATGYTDATGLDTASALNNGNTFNTNTVTGLNTGINSATSLNTGIDTASCMTPNDSNGNVTDLNTGNEPVETLRSIIDNLPAIDSDVNANDTGIETDINTGMNTVIC